MATSSAAISAYRGLLRAASAAFKGDATVLPAAQKEIRDNFEARRFETDPARIAEAVTNARDAAEFVSGFIVQAQPNERGNLELKIEPKHDGKEAEIIEPGMIVPKRRRRDAVKEGDVAE